MARISSTPYPQWFIDDLVHKEDKQKALAKEITSRDYLEFMCPIHGVYIQRVAEHINIKTMERKHGCPQCGKEKSSITRKEKNKTKRPPYPQWFIEDIANSGDRQRATSRELTWSDKISFVCKKHGSYIHRVDAHMDTTTFQPKQGCPICGKEKQQEHKKETEANNRNFPQWFIDELVNNEDKQRARYGRIVASEILSFRCPKHGVYKQLVSNHITLSTGKPHCKCPICTRQVSKYEDELYSYILSLGIEVEKRNRTLIRNPVTNRPLELDLYIPSKRIAIEYNGSLWHSERYKKDKLYHQTKFRLCRENNIHLVSVFDCDWFERKEQVQNYLRYLFCPIIEIPIGDIIINPLSKEDSEQFYRDNSLYDIDHIDVSYGVIYNGRVLSLLSFYRIEDTWYMNPIVHTTISVSECYEYLFFRFVEAYKPSQIITYSNCDYTDGRENIGLGFQFVQYIEPDYYLVKDNVFYSKESEDILVDQGYYRVYRSGGLEWLWSHPF